MRLLPAGHNAATDQADVGDGVVWRAKRPLRHQPCSRIQHARDGVNLCRLQRLFKCQRCKNGRQPLGEHGLPRTGRANHENVVAACRRYFQRPLGRLLPAHIFEVDAEMLQLAQQRLCGTR